MKISIDLEIKYNIKYLFQYTVKNVARRYHREVVIRIGCNKKNPWNHKSAVIVILKFYFVQFLSLRTKKQIGRKSPDDRGSNKNTSGEIFSRVCVCVHVCVHDESHALTYI